MPTKNTDCSPPEGFELVKYEECAQWTERQWLRALSFRAELGYAKYLSPSDPKPEGNEVLRKTVERIIQNPLADGEPVMDDPPIADQTVWEFFNGAEAIQNNNDFIAWRYAVVFDSYNESDEVPEFLGLNTSLPLVVLEALIEQIPAWKMHESLRDRRYGISQKPFIKVNMLLPDSVLVKAFEGWLHETRRRLNGAFQVKEMKKRIDIGAWYAKRYLPILDLKFWAAVNEHKLGFEALTELVFPDWVDANGQDGVEVDNVRKTLFPNALELLSPSTLRGLQYIFHHGA